VMADQLSDAILLERFVSRREEAAFDTLVRRHGPIVEGVCRRVLRNDHDIEEVLQATFLVLARKAAGMPWRESVQGWLCAVAHRLALGARAERSRRTARVASFATAPNRRRIHDEFSDRTGLPEECHPALDPWDEVERRDLRRVLDDELLNLPEKYRAPVVLCYLEGRTHAEAARELGWPAGSMSRRLERARSLLKRRLVCRGVTLAIGLIGTAVGLYAAARITQRDMHSAQSVHRAMTSLAAYSPEIEIVRHPASSASSFDLAASGDRDLLVALARQAKEVADAIEEHDPGTNRDAWRRFAGSMQTWAGELGQAAARNDRPGMIVAARGLNSSCVNCHNLFVPKQGRPPETALAIPAG
jgi:RNA polymerase sigma factor (sigma-70 family)